LGRRARRASGGGPPVLRWPVEPVQAEVANRRGWLSGGDPGGQGAA
jgi:hypothetical protein